MSAVPTAAVPAADEKEEDTSLGRTLLRLKRSSKDAGFDQLVTRKQKQPRTCSTPRTLKFRRLLSSNPETPVKNRRVIDVNVDMLMDSPSSSCGPATPLKPADAVNDVNDVNSAAHDINIATPTNSAAAAGDDVVYDLYEEIKPADDVVSAGANTRIGWLDSTMLPAEFFGDLIPSDEEDADYSEGDERSVDYPSTPSSSVDSTDYRAQDGDDDDDNISDSEIGFLDRVLDMNLLRGDAYQPPAYSTRSRLRTQQPAAENAPGSSQSK